MCKKLNKGEFSFIFASAANLRKRNTRKKTKKFNCQAQNKRKKRGRWIILKKKNKKCEALCKNHIKFIKINKTAQVQKQILWISILYYLLTQL